MIFVNFTSLSQISRAELTILITLNTNYTKAIDGETM